MKRSKKTSKRRSGRQASERALVRAFEGLLQRHGVTGVGVNAVLGSAGVGKRLLYEYFGDLEGLAAAWARERRDPLALAERGDALRRQLDKVGPAERIGMITQDYACSLRDHPWASQVLLAELQRGNAIARAMSKIRREIGAGHEGLLITEDTRSDHGLMGMAFILHAAANYLVLRARFAPDYNGLDLGTREGWDGAMRMLGSIAALAGTSRAKRPPAKANAAATRRRAEQLRRAASVSPSSAPDTPVPRARGTRAAARR